MAVSIVILLPVGGVNTVSTGECEKMAVSIVILLPVGGVYTVSRSPPPAICCGFPSLFQLCSQAKEYTILQTIREADSLVESKTPPAL